MNKCFLVLGVLFVVFACGRQPAGENGNQTTASAQPGDTALLATPEPAPTDALTESLAKERSTPNPSSDESVRRLLDLAKKDLSTRLSIGQEQIILLDVAPITWPDDSLGCPQPDMEYAQVLTPGYILSFDVHGDIYTYHTDMNQAVYCPNIKEKLFLTPSDIFPTP